MLARARRRSSFWAFLFGGADFKPDIARVLEQHDPAAVSALAGRIRVETEWAWYDNFRRRAVYDPGQNLRLVRTVLAIDADAAFPLMTVWSGHVREASVNALTHIPGPFCFALLLQRLNDWVAPVRKAAETKLIELRSSISTSLIVDCIDLLWDFERFGRAEPSARILVGALANDASVLAILRAQALEASSDRGLHIFRRLLRTPLLDEELPRLAVESRHPIVRAMVTRALLQRRYRWRDWDGACERRLDVAIDAGTVARAALLDSSPLVQAAAVEYIVEHGRNWPDYEEILLPLASHPRGGLAEVAQWGLTQAGVDWLAALRSALIGGDGPNPSIARALAKAGNAEDADRLSEIAKSLTDEVAAPFLASAARLKNANAIERLRAIALSDAAPRTARRAARALQDAGVLLSSEDLQAAVDQRPDFFARGLGFHLGAARAMDQLKVLARLERARTAFDFEFWFEKVARKINRGMFAPSPEELREFNALLTAAPRLRERAATRLAIGA